MHKFNRSWVRRMPSTMKWITKDSWGSARKRFCTSTRTPSQRIPWIVDWPTSTRCASQNPNAPPTFVRQYKIPIASYEPVQEIAYSMLEKGVIRPSNSTYSAPIWPVLKRPTIDYRKLNQQVSLSRWPITQLDQEIPKIKGSTILSTLDVASGFWTIPVHPDDQHKLAFTFSNRQYTFTRCPFGYANSPAESNIFLNPLTRTITPVWSVLAGPRSVRSHWCD